MGVQGEKWVVKRRFNGEPVPADFELVKEDLGQLKDGEIAFTSEYISVDPYQVRPSKILWCQDLDIFLS